MLTDPVSFKANEDLKPVFVIAVDHRDRRERKGGVWSKVAHEHFRFSYAPAMLSGRSADYWNSTIYSWDLPVPPHEDDCGGNCHLLQSNNHVTWWIHLVITLRRRLIRTSSVSISAIKIEVIGFCETLTWVYQSTWRHIPEDSVRTTELHLMISACVCVFCNSQRRHPLRKFSIAEKVSNFEIQCSPYGPPALT